MAQLFKFEFNLQIDGLHLGRTANVRIGPFRAGRSS